MPDKTIGVVCDNYKAERMARQFKSAGLEPSEIHLYNDVTAFKFKVSSDEFRDMTSKINKIVHEVEFHFKRSN